MKTYKHLFFDLDHTLWDFEKNSAATLKVLYQDFNLVDKGIPDFETFCSVYERHNDKMWDRFRKGLIRREELRWKRMWHTLIDFKIGNEKLAHDMSEIYLEKLPNQGLLMPFANEVLQYCFDKNYKLHLITNGFENTQWQKMRTSGIDHYFDAVITSESSNSLKPHNGIFQYALQQTAATKEESLMIGDALDIDVLGARNFGMDQVYFNPAQKSHNDTVTYEINCLSELKEIL